MSNIFYLKAFFKFTGQMKWKNDGKMTKLKEDYKNATQTSKQPKKPTKTFLLIAAKQSYLHG